MSELRIKEIAWIAGLLEGEGCFLSPKGRYCSPIIQLIMTDKDVMIKAAKILGTKKVIKCKQDTRGKNPKQLYRTNVYGSRAIQWMMTLYTLLGERRQMKVREIIEAFKTRPHSPYPERKSYSRGATIVWSKEI